MKHIPKPSTILDILKKQVWRLKPEPIRWDKIKFKGKYPKNMGDVK